MLSIRFEVCGCSAAAYVRIVRETLNTSLGSKFLRTGKIIADNSQQLRGGGGCWVLLKALFKHQTAAILL